MGLSQVQTDESTDKWDSPAKKLVNFRGTNKFMPSYWNCLSASKGC